jgi:arylsulfatase A-like enzyme
MHISLKYIWPNLIGTFALLILISPEVISQKSRPNIIYIMADDLGYADLSGYGRKDYQTPNLDKLASEGIKFINAYSAAPVCTPTRVAFMTGQYPARHPFGLKEPMIPVRDSMIGLSPDIPSLSMQLKKAGYETALIGKWHLGFVNAFGPNKNGFDFFYGIRSGAADYVRHSGDGGRPDLYENDRPIVEDGYLTDLIKDRALKFLKQPHSKPFFLSLQFTAPHWPWQGPGDPAYPDTMRMSAGGSPAIFARMMKALDDAVGEILKMVEEQSLTKNTLIIFTSDNGGTTYSDNGIYQGRKLSLWEGGIRVPAFARWPGRIESNTLSTQVCVTMDWTATILAAAGVKEQPNYPLDGISLLPVFTGKSIPFDRTIYWRTIERSKHKAIRDGNWKYLKDEKGEYLFDLSNDPSEKNNLSEKNREIFDRLKSKYAAWEASVLKPDVASAGN